MKLRKKLTIILTIILLLLVNAPTYAKEFSIDAGAGILVEQSTGRILYEKNASLVKFPASCTKILTCICVLENVNLNEKATVSKNALDSVPNGYVTCNLQIGEELPVLDLLYALMVKSANDAAVVLAEHVSGSVEEFSNLMNQKAREIGCKNTHFVNPNGIHDENHYTTAYDLYKMADYALSFEHADTFKQLVSTTSYTLPKTNKYPSEDRTFQSTNELIIVNNNDRPDNYYYKDALGIKTGHTSQAGYCLVSSATRDNLSLISVVLDAEIQDNGLSERYTNTIDLFNYGFDNFDKTKVIEAGDTVKTIEINKATKKTKSLDVIIKDSIIAVNNKETNISDIKPKIIIDQNLEAPIEKNQEIGTITYTIDGVDYSSKLLASHDVARFKITGYLVFFGILLLLWVLRSLRLRRIRRNRRRSRKRVAQSKQNRNLY